MIGLIGIKKDTPLEIREKFIIKTKKRELYLNELLAELKEAVILATCNRTEIYFNASFEKEELLEKVFLIFNWNFEYRKYIFIASDKGAYRHLFEVCCGFHSKILGEDQILGQVKEAYEEAIKFKAVSLELHRLFQEAITAGKRFRKEAKLFEIPVSSASIVINEAIKQKCNSFMVLGYGEVGQLILKYLLSHKVEIIYLVVRNAKVNDEINDKRVKVIDFEGKNNYIDNVDCIISCTSAPHAVVRKGDFNEEGNKILVYDLAVPRDVEEEVSFISRTEVYNIDTISRIDDNNKLLRKERMENNKDIMLKYLNEYEEWLKLREVSPVIQKLRTLGNEVYEKRSKTFIHKSDNDKDRILADRLIKSTSDFYINRAIEVVKEEALKGSGEEWINIMQKIFFTKE